jgi:Ca2+-binding RTX toxin-like protein
MAVTTYGTVLVISGGTSAQEPLRYVSNNASDRFGGGNLGTEFEGRGGNDTIFARGGDDILNGGTGRDILSGGKGADAFVFDTRLGSSNVDRITDFSSKQGDKIALDNAAFKGLKPVFEDFRETRIDLDVDKVGGLAAEAFRLGKVAQDADDRVIYDRSTGTLSFDRDGIGGAKAVKFAQLKAGAKLSFDDFLIF